jgi:hypothetical protein
MMTCVFSTLCENLPRWFHMWLAFYPGHESAFLTHNVRDTTWCDQDFPGFPSGRPHAQVLTVVYGDLAIKTIFVGMAGRHVPVSLDRPPDPAVIQVWPPLGGDLSWPPQVSLDDDGWRKFINTGIPAILGMATPPKQPRP